MKCYTKSVLNMAEVVKFRCQNCGNRFEIEALSEKERDEARRKNEPMNQIHCPNCNRVNIRRGWE